MRTANPVDAHEHIASNSMPICCAATTGPVPRYTSYPTAPQFSHALRRRATSARGGRAATRTRSRASCRCTCTCRSASQPVLLLRLQPHHHARHVARGAPTPTRLVREIGHGGAAVRPRPRSRAAALRRRHAELPDARAACASWSTPRRQFFHFSDAREPRLLDRARSALRRATATSRARRHRLQSRQLRRAGFRSGGAAGGQPRCRASRRRCASIDACRATGFRSVNVDLIYGLPKQTLGGFRAHARHRGRARGRTASRSTATRTCRSCSRRSGRSTTADLPDAASASWRCCSWRSSRLTAAGYATSAWIISRCPTTTSRGAGARQPASQFHGLHDACRQRPHRPRRERDQPHRRQLQPELPRPADVADRRRPGPPAGRRAACASSEDDQCARTSSSS